MDLGFGTDAMTFASINQTLRDTGISICALRNASNKANMSITRRKGGFQTYRLFWPGKCKSCARNEIQLSI